MHGKRASARAERRPSGFRRRQALILLAAAVTLTMAAAALRSWSRGRPSSFPASLVSQLEDVELLSGDLVFRRGRSLTSRSVLALDRGTPFSHVGLIRVTNGSARVIHALPPDQVRGGGGILIEPLETFLSPTSASAAAVYRLRSGAGETGALAAAAAYRYALAAVPFDEGFNKDDGDALYCTELVWAAYREAGVDLVGDDFVEFRTLIRRGSYIMPSTLMRSPFLEPLPGFESGDLAAWSSAAP